MRAAGFLLPLLVLVGLSPGAAGALIGPALPIRAAEADLVYEIPVHSLVVNRTLEQGPCGERHFEERANKTMRFRERAGEAGCGEIGYLFEVPPKAERLYLAFQANRSLDKEFEGPTNAIQEVWVRNAAGVILARTPVVDPASGSIPLKPYWIPIGNLSEPSLQVSWYYEDVVYSPNAALVLPGQVSSQGYQVHISGLRLWALSVPLAIESLGITQAIVNDTVLSNHLVQIRPRNGGPGAPVGGDIELLLAPDVKLTSLRGPQGRMIELERLQVRRTDNGTEVVIQDDLVAQQGMGAYVLGFTSTAPRPPAALASAGAPAGPTHIYPLVVGLLALPAVPAAFATRYGWGIRRTAHERHKPFVRQVLGLDLAFLAVYLGLCAYVIYGSRLPTMARLPLAPEGWLLNAEFLLLTAIFLFLWIAPTRHLVVLMRKDLAQSEEVQRQLKRSNEELEQFAYVASHDLQEPLRTISGFSHILKSRYGHHLDATARHYLELNVQSSVRMQRLINDLLAYSRVETRPLQREPVSLFDLTQEVVRDLERLRQKVNGRIRIQSMPVVNADRGQLRQVLLNLVQNALKYHAPGRLPQVVVGAEIGEREVILYVRDNGKGIEPRHHEKVFRMFQRLEPRGVDDDGTGLGLAIVQRVAERHGGRVWLESQPGVGSIFRVAIPKEPGAS